MRLNNFVIREIEKMINEERRKIDKAHKIALNRAVKTAKSRTIKFIREGYSIKKQDLDNEIKMIKSGKTLSIKAVHKALGLIKYGAKQTKTGVIYKTKSGGKRGFIKSAFITEVGKGRHIGVFKRKTEKRLPIQEKFGPSAEQLISSQQAREVLSNVFYERFKIELERAIKYGK